MIQSAAIEQQLTSLDHRSLDRLWRNANLYGTDRAYKDIGVGLFATDITHTPSAVSRGRLLKELQNLLELIGGIRFVSYNLVDIRYMKIHGFYVRESSLLECSCRSSKTGWGTEWRQERGSPAFLS